jgi:4,5:9,10-diseco-3-hydroxy-5,9,17-trioxoandrosta-1(10),2-diene-4-oate hydrolase
VVLALGAVVFLLWPVPSARDTGSWMPQAGVEPRYETLDGLRIRYVRKGDGPPVLLLHGIASSLYTWKDVLPALAARHDVVAMDLPGFGDSAVPDHASGAGAMRSVVALLDRLGLARVSIVGNSLGGALAVAIAAGGPDRVDRVVLIDAAGYNFATADRPLLLRMAGAIPAPVLEALPVRPMVSLGLRQVFHDDALVTADKVAEYVAPMRRPGASAALHQLLLGTDDLHFPGVIREVRAPTLILWGRYDAWIPPRDAERFAADIPGARVVMLEAGHMPQEERPAETAARIEEFLGAEVSAPVRPGSPAPSGPPSSPGTR